ncbi:MAG: LysR family transcriptional regulator [Cumulibacter sp.]
MSGILDITPLRSFVAIADNGGFQRAADALHLSQAAVSQHVRRLERTLDRALVERDGRTSRLTADGETLLGYARRILQAHDRAMEHFHATEVMTITIGSTEHAATQLLPALTAALSGAFFDHEVRLRLDRGTRLREDLAIGRLDLAILPGPPAVPDAKRSTRTLSIGTLDLTWFCAPGWEVPDDARVPLAVFESPCALRSRAMEALDNHGYTAVIGAESLQLAGVHAAAAAGAGVALLATLGQTPPGLVPCTGLPEPEPLEFSVWGRPGLDPSILEFVVAALRRAVERTS